MRYAVAGLPPQVRNQEWIEKYEVNRIQGGLFGASPTAPSYRKVAQRTSGPLLLCDTTKLNQPRVQLATNFLWYEKKIRKN